jgi:hypothetical protein
MDACDTVGNGIYEMDSCNMTLLKYEWAMQLNCPVKCQTSWRAITTLHCLPSTSECFN